MSLRDTDPFQRRFANVVHIGHLPMGGDFPVRVQSMTNTDTLDTESTVEQAIRMTDAGCEYVRIAVPGIREAENLANIKKLLNAKGYHTPLIADVHFNPAIAEIAARVVEKVRINPGNYTGHDPKVLREDEMEQIASRIKPLLSICRDYGTAIRIGVNHGSLSPRIVEKHGNTASGMVESALEFANVCSALGFENLVLSMKASNTRLMIAANRLLVSRLNEQGFHYPLHLGVTEAGAGEDGRIRSAIGIGSLLADGIGDTIRVSLTEEPEAEIPVAYAILQAAGVRISGTEFISCPSCGRTLFDIQSVLKDVKTRTSHLAGLKIAVMGCIVNGPGEMADADYGYVGAGNNKVNLYRKKDLVARGIPAEDAVDALISLIIKNGDWREPGSLSRYNMQPPV